MGPAGIASGCPKDLGFVVGSCEVLGREGKLVLVVIKEGPGVSGVVGARVLLHDCYYTTQIADVSIARFKSAALSFPPSQQDHQQPRDPPNQPFPQHASHYSPKTISCTFEFKYNYLRKDRCESNCR
jgi:hypothetical protein